MEQLLKRGAYALLDDDNDKVTQEFCADDIEAILAKRTRTRVVEGAKTSSWLNKQGMLVSKSKFTTEEGDQLDMDDPLFWQKVMPDFVTPSILLKKLNELIDEIEGTKRGPGRGRWRLKRKLEAEAKAKAEAEAANAAASGKLDDEVKKDRTEQSVANESPANVARLDEAGEDVRENAEGETMQELSDDGPDDEEEEEETGKPIKTPLSRAHIRKIAKFVSEVKSLMNSIMEEDDDEGLAKEEQDQCQKLLLTISLKEKYFNEEQRHLARSLLKSIEGDRKRRCRTTEQHQRFQPGAGDDQPVSSLPEELMIRHRKKRKRMKKGVDAEDDVEADGEFPPVKRRKKSAEGRGAYIGEDGYLHHSDSEADWSDVAEDLYQVGMKRKDQISRKEAQRRRSWAVDDDAATAAGRTWPVFPRHVVKTVLSTILDEVMKYDEENGGVFSVPVPREEFPEYYEQIKNPMDYSTMKRKLENGEYRSAQAMQKDFVLILQNCRDFNDPASDIVKEARRQHLRRPKILKEAALKHDLFLAEDGSVLEIVDEEKSPKKRGKGATKDDKKKAGDGKSVCWCLLSYNETFACAGRDLTPRSKKCTHVGQEEIVDKEEEISRSRRGF
jgi:Bromodomain